MAFLCTHKCTQARDAQKARALATERFLWIHHYLGIHEIRERFWTLTRANTPSRSHFALFDHLHSTTVP